MQRPDRRSVLSSRSAEAHARLEAVAGSFETRAEYGRYLAALFAFRTPIEAALSTHKDKGFLGAWRPTRLADHLAQDLRDLELEIPSPRPVGLPARHDVDGWLGTLYVLEGSSLGARVISRKAERLGLDGGFGARHLAEQGGALHNWRGFLDLLEAIEPIDIHRASLAAIDAFRCAELAFGTAAP